VSHQPGYRQAQPEIAGGAVSGRSQTIAISPDGTSDYVANEKDR
jgi:hypothetical protein